MNPIIQTKILENNEIFKNLVLPVFNPNLPGELIDTNAANGGVLHKVLDQNCGWDNIVFNSKSGRAIPIAHRIQSLERPYPYDTFSIGYKLKSGHRSEWDRLVAAINNDDPYPKRMFHAFIYRSSNSDSLLSAAMVGTKELFSVLPQIVERKFDFVQEGKDWRIATNTNDGNVFIWVKWAILKKLGVKVTTSYDLEIGAFKDLVDLVDV